MGWRCGSMLGESIAAIGLLGFAAAHGDGVPAPLPAHLEHLGKFASRHVEPRNVDVWVPEGYGGGERYDVIYMQDGQMLFDPSAAWNGKSWDAGRTLSRLIKSGQVHGTLIVGIWNGGAHRHAEYFPGKMLKLIPQPQRSHFIESALAGKSRSDDYLRFLVEELKPYIDGHFATRPEKAHTFVMGSSMGALISIYAICEYPEVFGGAAGLSTHWIGSFEANAWAPLAAINYLSGHLPDPKDHRLYMDHGTVGLDALYGVAQAVIDQVVLDRGYTAANWSSRQFEGAGHSEDDWARRFDIPVQFLENTPRE